MLATIVLLPALLSAPASSVPLSLNLLSGLAQIFGGGPAIPDNGDFVSQADSYRPTTASYPLSKEENGEGLIYRDSGW